VVLVPSAASSAKPTPAQAVRLLPSPPEVEARGAKQASRKEKETQAQRLQKLEQRMSELEYTVAALRADWPGKASRFEWLPQLAGSEFSSERAEALRHNLRAITARRITIHYASGDEMARERAHWFKQIFEHAECSVEGPDARPVVTVQSSLYLATTLPVSPEAASMFIALRAAGFAVSAVFDPSVRSGEERLFVG
jgi:hypothetical protein